MSAAVVTRRGRPPRARHDAGTEPLDWRRVVLVLGLIAFASGGAVATAGAMRQGPLQAIGWIDRERQVVDVDVPDERLIEVFVRLPGAACTQRVSVEVRETTRTVELGPVHSKEPRFVVPPCTAPARAAGEHAVAKARLSEPLGFRTLLVNGKQIEPDTL